MPTIKQLETALVNADRAGDEEAARALAAEIRRMRAQGAQAPKAAPKQEQPGRLMSFAKGALGGAADVILSPVEALIELGAKAGIPTLAEGAKKGREGKADAARRQAIYRQAHPNYFTAGEILGQTAASAPLITAGGAGVSRLGGSIAAKAPRAGAVVQRVGRAIQTGGIGSGRTAAQTAALSRGARVGQLAERMAGGAIAGGAGAALTGQDVQTGATFGAGLPVVASVLKRVGGFAGDITKLPRQKAAEIIRKALGDKADEARAVFAQLSPDDKRLAEQVLIEAGVEPDPFFGIGKVVQEQTVAGAAPMREALESQAQARAARLAEVGGGATATERRFASELARQGISEATGPAREAALAGAAETLNAAPMVEALRTRAAEPGIRATAGRRALLKLARQIEDVADESGMVDPADLYALRKEASDIVEKYVSSSVQPSTGSKKRAAGLVINFKNMVDEALGPEFKDYLSGYRTGMEGVNRQELAAKGAQLAAEQPNEFIKLMGRDRPKIVEDVMGRGAGQYDIAQVFEQDPARFAALQQSADELATLNRMAELRASGTGPAGKIMVTATPTRMSRGLATLAGIPYTPLGFAARGGEQVERAFMAPRVERELAGAYLSGPAMGELLNTFPMKARISEAVSQMSPQTRNFLAQLLRGYSATPSETNYPE